MYITYILAPMGPRRRANIWYKIIGYSEILWLHLSLRSKMTAILKR